MEKLITPKDVSERYGCSLPTARKYIRRCNPHMEDPLVVPEWAFREWEKSRTVSEKPKTMPKKEYERLMRRIDHGDMYIPRKREG